MFLQKQIRNKQLRQRLRELRASVSLGLSDLRLTRRSCGRALPLPSAAPSLPHTAPSLRRGLVPLEPSGALRTPPAARGWRPARERAAGARPRRAAAAGCAPSATCSAWRSTSAAASSRTPFAWGTPTTTRCGGGPGLAGRRREAGGTWGGLGGPGGRPAWVSRRWTCGWTRISSVAVSPTGGCVWWV